MEILIGILALICLVLYIILKHYISLVWEIIRLKSSIKNIEEYKPRDIISIQHLGRLKGKYEEIFTEPINVFNWLYSSVGIDSVNIDTVKLIYLSNHELSPISIVEVIGKNFRLNQIVKLRGNTPRTIRFWKFYHKVNFLTTLQDIPKIKESNITLKKIKMKVYCFSLADFKRLVKEFDLKHTVGNVAIISIVNPKGEDNDCDFTTEHPMGKTTNENILNVSFLDDGEDFTPTMAKDIIKFIEKQYKLGNDFYVHCIAGLSRSQAICRFILDTIPEYTYGRELENPLKTPNQHVLSTLKRVYRAEFEDFTISV